MKICDINKIKNKEYIVLLPKIDLDIKESVEYSFENVFYLDYELTDKDAKTLIEFMNNKGNQLILFDYSEFYRLILPYIKKSKKIKWILKDNIAAMTDGAVRATYTNLMEFADRNIVDEIGCLDKDTYLVLKNAGYKAKHLMLDIKAKRKKTKSSKSIGIIGNDYEPNHNTYNQLSAVKMVDYSYIKILKHMPATRHFIRFFDIREKEVDTIEKVMKDNFINLYCNFTLNNNEIILKSMDMGIPCILGNCDIFNKYPKLKKYLVLNSDDDINEIAYKIKTVKENSSIILKEYDKFRKDYILNSEKSIKNFLK